ncbi:DUF5655 domain-containing protein [Nocardia crassostreae]|uniref:DUF5655 domain-containing protein n=1 Tax=Nocardia crassostreae TaxID=53428 RepID=UPI00082BC513|nr:DUF5655 domain-containing protein [Nocardia crassostreae]
MGEVARTLDEFFTGSADGAAIGGAVAEMVDEVGPAEMRISKSQIAFRRRRGFAYLWVPGRYVKSDVLVVLSIALPYEVRSARFKEVAHPAKSTWMHHIELRAVGEIDGQVLGWVTEAYDEAG